MDCNYGENYAPFDHWFDSYAADTDDFEALSKRRSEARKSKTVKAN